MGSKDLWKARAEDNDFPAAEDYLSLVMSPAEAAHVVASLREADIVRRRAKDLLRAARLPALPTDNPHVKKHLAKIKEGGRLSPVLLVRGDAHRGLPLLIADGYHRISASWHVDEDAEIPCHMADLPLAMQAMKSD